MYNPGPKVKPVELRTTTTDLYENRVVEQSKTIHLPMQFMTRDVFLNIWKREKKIMTVWFCCDGYHSSWDIGSFWAHLV